MGPSSPSATPRASEIASNGLRCGRICLRQIGIPTKRSAAEAGCMTQTPTHGALDDQLSPGSSINGSSSSVRRWTTRSPTGSAPSCCCCRPRTRAATSACTSTRPAARSAPGWPSTTRCALIPNDVSTLRDGPGRQHGPVPAVRGNPRQAVRLPHAQILMHQGSAGFGGTAADVEIYAEQLERVASTMLRLIAEHTGQPVETIERDSRARPVVHARRRRAHTGSSTTSSTGRRRPPDHRAAVGGGGLR